MTRPFDICIRGAGIVGRTLALHLASKQLRVALVGAGNTTPQQQAANDVRAYALNQASRRLLEAVRCWPDATHATPVLQMRVQEDDGGQVAFDAVESATQALNWIVDVPVLEALLADAVRFQPLIEPVEAPVPAALTVVCEGKFSTSRQEFGVEWDVAPYSQWALATRVQRATPHAQTAHQWFHKGEILAFLPLGGAAGNLFAVVWSVSPERARALVEMTDAAFCQELEAASHTDEGQLTLHSSRRIWPLQHAVARRWSGAGAMGGWVLAGDAAHNVHPLAGQGLNMGLADVAELAGVLEQRAYWRSVGDPRLLRRYERARKADFAIMGRANDVLQQLFTNDHPTLQAMRNWGMAQFEHSGPIKQWVARRAMGTRNQF